MVRLNHGYKNVACKSETNVCICKKIKEKNLLVVVDSVAVADPKFSV